MSGDDAAESDLFRAPCFHRDTAKGMEKLIFTNTRKICTSFKDTRRLEEKKTLKLSGF